MALSNDIISQFAKLTAKPENTKTESTAYGTAKIENDTVFVKIDGSDRLTPVQTAVDVEDGERVIVNIKDHTVTITGNTSSPAARVDTVKEQGKKIDEFDIIVAHKVTTDELSAVNATIEHLTAITANYENMSAVTAEIETLKAKFANLQYLTAEEVTALNGEFESLKSTFASFTDMSTEDLQAANAEIDNLVAYTAKFTYVETELLKAYNADIGQLNVNKLESDWANIDFANIDKAVMDEFYASSGLIQFVTAEDATVTGHLIGVTISGDLIEAGTIKADKLLVKGDNGLYYKLNVEGGVTTSEEISPEDLQNGLHGNCIIANTITADKINVSDLVAFGATIGGFYISDGNIHSGVKETVDNTTQGVYLDKNGQMNIGDSDNFIKYYKTSDGTYKLDISAANILLGGRGNSLSEVLSYISINPVDGSITFGAGENAMSLSIENDLIAFKKNNNTFGWWDGVDFHTGNIKIDVTERAQFGNFAYIPRSDGSLSFLMVENNDGIYARQSGSTMIIYNSYPIIENSTLIFNDVTGTLNDTTLTLGG